MMRGNVNLAKKFGMEKMATEIDGQFVMHVMASITCSVQEFITRRNNIMKQTLKTNYFYVKNVNNKILLITSAQWTFTCSKSTLERIEQDAKCVQK